MLNHTKSTAAFTAAKNVIPGGVNSPVRSFRSVGGNPPFVARGCGSKLYDLDDNEYIDYIMSYGPLLLGHAPSVVTKAITAAATNGTSYGIPTKAEITLAEMLCQLVPSMDMVRMVNSGTEATMSALRLARAYTGRDYIVKFIGCYHGHSDGLLVKAGSAATTLGTPDSPGVPKGTVATTLLIPFNDTDALENLFAEKGQEIAAVIMEPTPGNMGLVLPQPGFLQKISQITKKYGSLVICDEVMSGFRSAQGGSQSLYALDPDITCLGKVIGGGLPVAAYGGKRHIMSMVSPMGPMYQAGTLSGNPLAMAAGIVSLKYMVEHDVCAKLTARTAILVAGLQNAAEKAGLDYQFHHLGSMFTVFFTKETVTDYATALTCDLEAFKIYFHSMLEQGFYLPPSQFETNFISLAHSDEDFEKTLQAAEIAFKEVAKRK